MQPGHPDTTTDNVRIPGVRYRRRRNAIQRPVTRDGRTHWVAADAWEPRPPLDVDLIVRRAVLVLALILVTGVVVWSTVSITQLLSTRAPTWAALCAAAVYDTAWIICLALEWLARYDRQRARAPRIVGWIALAVAMVAIWASHTTGGGDWHLGAVGAAASGLAKICWALLLRHYTHRLDADTRAWVEAERGDLAGQQVVGSLRRDVARSNAHMTAQLAALGLSPETPAQAVLPTLAQAPALPATPTPPQVSVTRPSAVPPVPQGPPAVSTPPVPAVPVPVSSPAPTPADTAAGHQDTGADSGDATVSSLSEPTMSSAVREALAHGITDGPSILAHVQATFPGAKPPTVRRLLYREHQRAQKAAG